MYIARQGKVYAAPFGSEFLGDGTDGVPLVYFRNGWVGPMVPVSFKRPEEAP